MFDVAVADPLTALPPGILVTHAQHHIARAAWSAARTCLEEALTTADAWAARLLLWEVCQVLRDEPSALRHLRAAVAENPLSVRPAANPGRRVLALAVPGSFQANLPLASLLPAATTELSTFWIADAASVLRDPLRSLAAPAARFGCAFVAIAEDARHHEALHAADALVAALGIPAINNGQRIAALSRSGASRLLAGVPGAVVPEHTLLSRAALATEPPAFPLIVRPRHSHAGAGLACVQDQKALAAYLAGVPDDETTFDVAPFVDYRSTDGQWRKYRIIFVDGRPYPFHLAIHDDWAVWYYNAGMERDAAKRAEEARFLSGIATVFPAPAIATLGCIATRVGLDYFGLDCALLADGRVLVFEVETGMLVHDLDPPDLFPYKKEFVPRIFRAVEAMIDARIRSAMR